MFLITHTTSLPSPRRNIKHPTIVSPRLPISGIPVFLHQQLCKLLIFHPGFDLKTELLWERLLVKRWGSKEPISQDRQHRLAILLPTERRKCTHRIAKLKCASPGHVPMHFATARRASWPTFSKLAFKEQLISSPVCCGLQYNSEIRHSCLPLTDAHLSSYESGALR